MCLPLKKLAPRGSIKAPESVTPDKNIDIQVLQKHYNKVLTALGKVSELNENKHFNHPILGTIDK